MDSGFIDVVLGFIEGFGLIISPCILPILPVFLAGALTGSKRRPLGMMLGFILFFALLVFFSRQLVSYFDVDFNLMRNVGYGILFCLGLILFSNYLSEKFNQITRGVTQAGAVFATEETQPGGFLKGLLLGGLIAIVWTPCAGPILAAIIVQTVVQKATWISFLTLVAFALGAIIPLFIISLYGKKIINTFAFFKSHASCFRKGLGILLMVSVIYLAFFEDIMVSASVSPTGIKTSTSLIGGLWRPYPAPKIEGTGWINSPPLKLQDLKGKVVLIDFWTYSCINCLRTLPHVKEWYKRYHDKGLVIIGVHTPEFQFESSMDNVKTAVVRDGILYPVVLDNKFATWLNFRNHYWPAHYLINKEGEVVYQHFVEGDYDITENNIRFLLGINDLATIKSTSEETSFSLSQTAETYLGYTRADTNLSPALVHDKTSVYHFSEQLPLNSWSLDGLWQVNPDNIISAGKNAALKIHFNARKIFMVMGNSTKKPIEMTILLNGVEQSRILVDRYSLYEVVSLPKFSSGILEIVVAEPGVKIFTFTFGS